MKKLLLAAIVMSVLNGSANAQNWNGFYAGALVGTDLYGSIATPLVDGVAGSVIAGYRTQINGVVIGAEIDGTVSSLGISQPPFNLAEPSTAAALLTVGFPSGNFLPHAMIGPAIGVISISGYTPAQQTQLHFGFQAGAGLDVSVDNNWLVRAQYLFTYMYPQQYAATGWPGGIPFSTQHHSFRLGAIYRFN